MKRNIKKQVTKQQMRLLLLWTSLQKQI